MNVSLGLHTILLELRQHWVSALIFLLTLVTILSLAAMRWWFRRRWKRLLEEKFEGENELDYLPSLGPEDGKALELIRKSRHEVWQLPESELRLGLEFLSQRALQIIRSIAAVYHPQSEIPEYEASLLESLQLIRRVAARLSRVAAVTPFRFLGERKLSDFQRYYQVYRKLNENPLLQALKQHRHLYRVAQWALNVKNIGNPLYWAGKELTREGYFFVLRWFYLTFISQVGREAMRLYSGRHFQKEEDRDAALICYRLFAMTRKWGGPSPREWSTLVDFVATRSTLEAETRIQLLARVAQGAFPKDLEKQDLQTRQGVKWYRRGLKRLLEADPQSSPDKAWHIEEELAALEGD